MVVTPPFSQKVAFPDVPEPPTGLSWTVNWMIC
jgi:hypothetical protein